MLVVVVAAISRDPFTISLGKTCKLFMIIDDDENKVSLRVHVGG